MGKRGGRGKSEWLIHTLQRTKTEEAVDHCQNNIYIKAVGTSPVWSNLCTLLTAVSTAVQSRVTKTTSVAQQLMNNWSKRLSNFLSPAPPSCSWSLFGSLEDPAPPPPLHLAWTRKWLSNSSWESSSPPSSRSYLDSAQLRHVGKTRVILSYLKLNTRQPRCRVELLRSPNCKQKWRWMNRDGKN